MNIRIIQVRDADDQMLQHELECIERRCRMARGPLNLNLSNAIKDLANEDWLDDQSADTHSTRWPTRRVRVARVGGAYGSFEKMIAGAR